MAHSIETMRERGFESMPDYDILAVTVPGAVDAWYEANQALGKLEFPALLQAAIHYAEQGYAVSPVIAHNWSGASVPSAQCPPGTFEFVNLGNEVKDLGGNCNGIGMVHDIQLHPFEQVAISTKYSRARWVMSI